MKILVDARPIVDPAGGGVTRVAREIVAAYAEAFPEDTLLCVTTGWAKPELPDGLRHRANVTHVHIRIPNKLFSALTLFGLSLPTAYCLLPTASPDAFFLPNLGFVGSLPRRMPTILLLHDLSFVIEPRWFTWKQRLWHRAVRAQKLIRSATRLLAVSETTKRDAIRLLGIPEQKISVIPIGPTLRPASCALRPFSASRFVLALGGNDPRKNVATAIEAVNALRREKEFEDVKLVRAGKDVRPSDDELASLYSNASAFLYPSWYEGYGLPLHEAAAFGTPCIASTAGALPETAPPGTLFANPAKPHHWIEALRIALSSPRNHIHPPAESAWKAAATALHEQLMRDA